MSATGHRIRELRRGLIALAIGIAMIVTPTLVPNPTPPDLKIDRKFYFPLDPLKGTIADVPADLRNLDGQRVTVTGVPVLMESNFDAQVVSEEAIRHHHQPPLVQCRVFVRTVPGSAAASASLPIQWTSKSFSGVFHVGIKLDSTTGWIASVFTMDVDQVGPPGSISPPRPLWQPLVRSGGIAIAALVVVKWALMTMARRRLRVADLCRQCGYDLRATPDRCPECGAIAGSA